MLLQKIYHRLCICLLPLLLALILVVSFSSPLHAASIDERTMVNLTLIDGLAGETVRKVMTDHNGYTWIATTGGVSIFNGQNIMSVRITNEKGRSLEVRDLCETRSHTFYAATESGLYRWVPTIGVFEHILPEVERPISLMAVGDSLFIGGEQGLQIYDGKRLTRHSVGASRKGLDNIVRYFEKDDRGNIWYLMRHDLVRIAPQHQRTIFFDMREAIGRHALSQFAYADGRFFIGTCDAGLFVYDPQSRQGRHIEGVGKIVMSVSKSHDGLIAIATDGSGAYLVDPKTEQVVERFSMDQQGMHRLPTNALYSFYRDQFGVNWFGTVRHGLVYCPHNSRLFKPYESDGFSALGMNVRSFCVRGSETLLGLQDGLWLIDSERHICKFYSPDELGGHIVNNICYWQGNYFIGMFDGGVRQLNPQTLTLSHQPFSPLLEKVSVGDIKVSPKDHSLWIGCSDGLFVIQPAAATTPVASATATVRQFTEQNSRITGGIIISITFDQEGNAWLTGSRGLSIYSAASHGIEEPNFPKGFFNQESNMRGILGVHGTIFMRNGPQLFYTSPDMEHFGEVTLPLHLTDKWCRGMVDSGNGRLWLSSERGLLGIDYEGKNLIQIGEGEGLLGKQISDLWLDGDSTLWVATSEGLFNAQRKGLQHWVSQTDSRVTLHNIRISSDLLNAGEICKMAESGKIRLEWNLVSQPLQAEPLLLDYACQQGRFFEYSLDGGEWQLVDNSRPIDVRHLLLGTHQLTVRMAGVKGTETNYQLLVVPSVAAYVELVLLVVALVLLWLWWRYRKNTKVLLTERNEIENALIEVEEQLQDISLTPHLTPLTSDKYQKVKIDEAECADVVNRMKEYLERERVFTNAELKMKDLADVLHLSAPKLSQVFNLYLGQNYYDFINQYRLEEFKRLIVAGEYKRYTITALSEQCGFKRSNFFSTFRKVEGMTPAEYLKKQGVKNALT